MTDAHLTRKKRLDPQTSFPGCCCSRPKPASDSTGQLQEGALPSVPSLCACLHRVKAQLNQVQVATAVPQLVTRQPMAYSLQYTACGQIGSTKLWACHSQHTMCFASRVSSQLDMELNQQAL